MIINVKQTTSNIKQTYDVDGDGLYYQGKAGSFSKMQQITLTNRSETIFGTYHPSPVKNYIPFRYLFGRTNITRCFDIQQSDKKLGKVLFSENGFLKSFYQILANDCKPINCYIIAVGSFQYACLYEQDRESGEEKQIALIETFLNVNDYKYAHKVYLLDDYKSLSSVISFFAIYYSSYSFSKRFHMSIGSSAEKRLTVSKYKDKYDPSWRETNFPKENFWGSIGIL